MPPELAEFKSQPVAGGAEVWLKNLSVTPGTDRPLLSVQVLLSGTDIHAVREPGTEALREYLNVLSLVTSMSFTARRLIRIVDWTLGLRDRDCLQFERFPGANLPFPHLESPVLETVDLLRAVAMDPLALRAVRWFAAGIRAEAPEEQFQFFWLALELLAQLHKSAAPVNDLCSKCRAPLFCETCKAHSIHRPYPKQAIRELFVNTVTKGGETLFEHASEARNALMHGALIDEVLKKSGTSLERVVNALGQAALKVILDTMVAELASSGTMPARLNILHTNMYTHQVLTAEVHLIVTSKDPNAPKLSEFARPTMSLVHSGSDTQRPGITT